MNINKKRHELLSLLFKKRADIELQRSEYNILGISFEEIEKSLKLTSDNLLIVSSELMELKEISFYNFSGVVGLACLEKGATSFSNRKYIKLNNAKIKNDIKDIVQILIPVLSLIITLLVIINSGSEKSKEIQAIDQKVESIQNNINMLENNLKKNAPTEKQK